MDGSRGSHAGDAVGARRARNEAVRIAVAAGQTALLAKALTALDAPTLWLLREYDEVELAIVHQLRGTLDGLPAENEALRCRLLATLAWESYDGAEDPAAENLSAEAVAIARRLNEPALLAFALNSRVAGDEILSAASGDLLVVPAGMPHAFGAPASAPAELLVMVSPGVQRFDYFRQLMRIHTGAESADSLLAVQDLYDTYFRTSATWDSRRAQR